MTGFQGLKEGDAVFMCGQVIAILLRIYRFFVNSSDEYTGERLADFDSFLIDHAANERKASTLILR